MERISWTEMLTNQEVLKIVNVKTFIGNYTK